MAWLYTHVHRQDENREPLFVEQSAVNWAKALRFEVEQEAGSNTSEQANFYRGRFRTRDKMAGQALDDGAIFEPAFAAITHAMSLTRISRQNVDVPWLRPIAVVTWYYAMYSAARSMFVACGQRVEDTHAAAMKYFASVLELACLTPLT